MKLTDYIADFLSSQGIKYVFGVTGGAAVHLFDSVGKHPDIQPVFTHHEQAAALAAKAYAHVRNGIGACFVTTGPGGTNAITGVAAAWQDSVPVIYISGQTRMEHASRGKNLRQLGTQEIDIISLVSPITKYAVLVDDPKKIKFYLQKAVHLATSGRPGPVWIDLPLNFQWTDIDPDEIPGFEPSVQTANIIPASIDEQAGKCLEFITKAKRPVILAGYGIRLSHGEKEFKQLIETLGIPVVATWNASDMISNDHELYTGRFGIAGQRGANLAVQNCDLLICIGSHLSIALTGTMFDAFAREAKIVMVDIDRVELDYKSARIDLPVQCDAKTFIGEMLKQVEGHNLADISWWQNKCSNYKRYNAVPDEWKELKNCINAYAFVDTLSDELGNNDVVVVDGGGTVVYTTFQSFKVKEGQRLTISSGICAMGTGLPESVGASFAKDKGRTICLCGDGSMQLNIQELQTIFHHNLPVKIFIFNNDGYLAIRHTQNGFLNSKYVGSDTTGGMSLPDYLKVAEAYGIKAVRVNKYAELAENIRRTLEMPGPAVCEIMIPRDQEVMPRQGFSKQADGTYKPTPLEDMYPFLDRKEFAENMVVAPWNK
jgi:acetolactate synthase-1/2/3 large subunit